MNLYSSKKISITKRLAAMFFDHMFMTFVIFIFGFPGLISGFLNSNKISHSQEYTENILNGNLGYFWMVGFALYFCKDILNGRSIAKRILNLQIVDINTGKAASPIKCFIRNIFCIIWPLEIIVSFVNTKKRIGDRVAGTELVEFNPLSEKPKYSLLESTLPLGISYVLMFFLFQLLPKIITHNSKFVESSYNQVESRKLEMALKESLSQFLDPDIKIYDTIENEKIKYFSVILKLKENYLDNDGKKFKYIDSASQQIIYSIYLKQSFTGQLKYIYKIPRFTRGYVLDIGTKLDKKSEVHLNKH